MKKSLLASFIVVALSACDSDTDARLFTTDSSVVTASSEAGEGGTTGNDDNTVVNNDSSVATSDDVEVTDDSGSATSDGGEVTGDSGSATSDGGEVTDDSGSATSDGGEVTDDSGSATSDGGEVTDDSGSATSDGGEVTDDSGSATSDGGQGTDDSGSATSDGGEVTDDSGSATSDGGGITDDSGSATSDSGETTDGSGTSDGGSFESDQIGGTVIRTSSLASVGQNTVCTTASAQNNFSDLRVGDFILHNNAWRPFRAFPDYQWEQCINTNVNGAAVNWYYDWGPGQTGINGNPNPSGDFFVRSYPELIYGVKDEFRTSAPQSVTGFPVKLSDMLNITIDYSYDGPQFGEPRIVDASNNSRFPNGTTISGERNVAIESFLYNPDENGVCSTDIVTRNPSSNHLFEIMVWLDAGAERLPAGPSEFVTDVSIRGDAFKVYTKGADPRYIAFVSQNPQTSGTLVWNDFTEWAQTYAHRVREEFGAQSNANQIQDDWCVANILVGTEIFWGSGDLSIFDWTITQRQP